MEIPGNVDRLAPAAVPRVARFASPPAGLNALPVRVLVLEFNPWIPGAVHTRTTPGAERKSLREVAGWNDPIPLALGYLTDLAEASGGLLRIEIVEWQVVRRFQKKTDGFVYTPETYVASLRDSEKHPWHEPDGVDYENFVREFDLVRRVESGEIDEVWMFGAPYFGYWESCMVGKEAFDVNGGVYDQIPCRRRFVIMGFNYERGVAEMLEDFCHRTEATLSRIYGGWEVDKLTTPWAKFAANLRQSGTAAVGTCHYPPNGEQDYDYANPRFVESTADDWLHYPDLTGRRRRLNCEEWSTPHRNRAGRPDYHRNYLRWWLTHLPKTPGTSADQRQNNWWEYVCRFNAYDASGRPVQKTP